MGKMNEYEKEQQLSREEELLQMVNEAKKAIADSYKTILDLEDALHQANYLNRVISYSGLGIGLFSFVITILRIAIGSF